MVGSGVMNIMKALAAHRAEIIKDTFIAQYADDESEMREEIVNSQTIHMHFGEKHKS